MGTSPASWHWGRLAAPVWSVLHVDCHDPHACHQSWVWCDSMHNLEHLLVFISFFGCDFFWYWKCSTLCHRVIIRYTCIVYVPWQSLALLFLTMTFGPWYLFAIEHYYALGYLVLQYRQLPTVIDTLYCEKKWGPADEILSISCIELLKFSHNDRWNDNLSGLQLSWRFSAFLRCLW